MPLPHIWACLRRYSACLLRSNSPLGTYSNGGVACRGDKSKYTEKQKRKAEHIEGLQASWRARRRSGTTGLGHGEQDGPWRGKAGRIWIRQAEKHGARHARAASSVDERLRPGPRQRDLHRQGRQRQRVKREQCPADSGDHLGLGSIATASHPRWNLGPVTDHSLSAEEGLEPPPLNGNQVLNLARLPIPPLRLAVSSSYGAAA